MSKRTKFKKKINTEMVKELLLWCKQRNEALKGTGLSCTLHPEKSEPCISCKHYDRCLHYEWEREFIHKKHKSAIKSKSRRKKKLGSDNYSYHDLLCLDIDDLDLSDFEDIDEVDCNCPEDEGGNLHADDENYPCKAFAFTCPDKDKCKKGQNCPWKQ